MAIVKFIASGCPMNNIFPYVMNRNKTEDGILVSGIHCTPESAFKVIVVSTQFPNFSRFV